MRTLIFQILDLPLFKDDRRSFQVHQGNTRSFCPDTNAPWLQKYLKNLKLRGCRGGGRKFGEKTGKNLFFCARILFLLPSPLPFIRLLRRLPGVSRKWPKQLNWFLQFFPQLVPVASYNDVWCIVIVMIGHVV